MAKHLSHIKERAYDGAFELVEWRNLEYPRWVCVGVYETRHDALEALKTRISA